MTSPRLGPRRARLASLLAALALAVPLAAAPGNPAAAADDGPARVVVAEAEVTDTTLTLSGTVTNTGTEPLGEVSVALWRSSGLLLSPQAVTAALSAATTTPGTARVVEDANRARLTGAGEVLAPGQSRQFTVSGSRAALGLTRPDATWWAGVDTTARGTTGSSRPVGSARTLVSAVEQPHPAVTLIDFSAPPRQLKKDLFLDDELHAEVVDGRLSQLLLAAEQHGTSWVVDPSLIAELEDMADGYRVQTPQGSDTGTGEQAAAAWLARLRTLPTATGATHPFGSPDLAALAALPDEAVAAAVRTTTDAAGPSVLPRLAVLERPDAAAVDLATRLGARVVAFDAAAPGVRVNVGDLQAVVATDSLPSIVSSELLPDTELNRRAARLAVARAAGGEVRVVRGVEGLLPDAPLPRGLVRASLADVWALAPRPWTPPADRTPTDAALDAARLDRVLDLRAAMRAYGAAAPGSGVADYADAQTARAASRWWIGRADAQAAWLAGVERRVGLAEGDMVTLDASPRFTMTGNTSEFPVTVTNRLVDPVTVRLVVHTDNPQRISLVAPEPVEIAPGASSTVLVAAQAAGGGVVRARVHVQTVDGLRLTPDREIVVETTNVGTIGWVIVVASGLVLVVTTGLRIRQVRQQRKGEDA